MSEGTIYNRVNRMLKEGIILGFSARADPAKFNRGFASIIYLKLDGVHLQEAQREIAEREEVRCVYDLTGEHNTLVMARFQDKEEFDRFLKELLTNKYVRECATHIVLNTVKEDFTVFGATPPSVRL